MLGKVIKYENKSMSRILLPLYLGLILSSLLNKLTLTFGLNHSMGKISEILSFVLITSYVILIIGVSFATFILIVMRFYKGCLGDEGYLTFTLPVKTGTHIWGRMLISAFWTLITGIITVLSLAIIMFHVAEFSDFFRSLGEAIHLFYSRFGGQAVLATVLLLLLFLVSLFSVPLMLYASASLGQLIMKKHKVLGGFLGYFILSILTETVTLFISIPLMNSDFLNFFGWTDSLSLLGSWNLMIGLLTLYILFFNVIYYVLTHFVLSRKLNLE